MTPFDRANTYLAIAPSFRVHLGGLQWSSGHDRIFDDARNTFALAEEVLAVLEGVFALPLVPPFAYVLTVYHRMKRGLDELAVAYGKATPSPALARNAGLFIAALCEEMILDLHEPYDLPHVADIRLVLGRNSPPVPKNARAPQVALAARPDLVDQLLTKALQAYTPDTLVAWLKYGGPAPTRAAAQLAAPVDELPLRVGKLFALAQRRPRLVGAAYLTPALDAALTFPPRRPKANAVPQGGYADVTTRGHPERLLLSQFALDADEFVRRFAERELLYFRPEEPHAPRPPDRVLILDQGVRTWGGVRLALAGCALALLAKPGRRAGRIAVVPSAGPVDVDTATAEELADALGASDLTEAPVGAIHAAFARPADGPRDFILLTHPRTLAGPLTTTALAQCPPADRVFTVAVDEAGHAEIDEWGDRGPVRVRAFRVDLAGAEQATAVPPPAGPSLATWAGDVEPVAFPFRPGVVVEPTVFGFDATGEWLVAASRDGTLQAIGGGNEPVEVLPRAFRGGVVLKAVEAILGVADGVVVGGRMEVVGPEPAGGWHVAAHYDRVRRRVRLHAVARVGGAVRWCATAARDAVGVRPLVPAGDDVNVDVNLATGERTSGFRHTDWASRTEAPPFDLPVWTRQSADPSVRCRPYLYLDGSAFEVRLVEPAWPRHEPTREGKPLLDGTGLASVQLAGGTLAVGTFRPGDRQTLVFRGPDARLVYALPRAEPGEPVALSPDGRLLARKTGGASVTVSETTGGGRVVRHAAAARLHNDLHVGLLGTPFPLVVRMADFVHTFDIVDRRLAHKFERRPGPRPTGGPVAGLRYDVARFPPKRQATAGPWAAAFDRLGQVVLLNGPTLVMAFLIRRDRAAARGPGGVGWGDPQLLGGRPTPDADRELAKLVPETDRP